MIVKNLNKTRLLFIIFKSNLTRPLLVFNLDAKLLYEVICYLITYWLTQSLSHQCMLSTFLHSIL